MNDGKEYKLDDSQATLRNELGNDEAYKAFIKSFVVLYSIDNNLKYDSERVDIVPVDMLPKVTTELTSPQTEMKFDSMQPYKIIELLPQQSDVSSNEGIKDLSVSDLYNAAAKKAMQAKPSVSTPINQDPSLMSPPRRRNSQRSKQTVTTQAQVPIPVQNAANPLVLMRPGNQTSVQQQVPQVQMHQPQVMTASQSPNQRPVQSPALIHTNFPPVQVPQSSTDGTRPIQQIPIPTIVRQVPIQIPNAQMPMQQVQLMQGQMVGQSNNVQVIQNITQGIPNIRPIGVRINNIPNLTHATQVNARSTVNQSVAQGATITSPSIHKIVPARRSTQGQSQQMNTPAQQTGQMNISPQMNSSPMNQIQVSPQINIPTQPTDPRVTPQLNVQSQMNQVQPAVQMNIPTQVSDQVNIQQTQTTPRINPGRVTPQMNAQAQMNQARSTPQINIPTQVSDQMQATLRMNPRMNVQLQSTDQNTSAQRINRPPFNNIQQQQQFIAAMRYRNGFRNPGLINMQNMQQQPFMQFGQNMMLHSQLLPGQQQGGIRPQMRPQIMRVQPQQVQQVQQVLIRQNIPIIQQQQMAQQLGVQMNGGQWVFPQNQIQPPQQPPNPQNPWNGNGNSGSKQ
ncbi:hypothetical protein C1645_321216 [Glomus cerebriforme]|uniref:Spt20 family-domain-containing protein n=1 Tax=Glomus cerebriforme TaxID=658196 RepID=A0A397SVG2_9GLOM|nr:hypothetical protein C1645_321216 [Glomus cerebriforme]